MTPVSRPEAPSSGRRRTLAPALAALAVVAGGLAGCGLPSRTERVVDFVQLEDRQYVRVDGDAVTAPDPATFGPEVAWTARKVGDPHGEPLRPGDAAYLEPGTALRAVEGFEPWFRLGVVLPNENTALYELATRGNPRSGADLLDLAAGVQEVVVQGSSGGLLGGSTDPGLVGGLVERLLALRPAGERVRTERPDLVLELRFAPPLAPVRRAVFVDDRSLGDQLALDDETLCAIEALAGRTCTTPAPTGG